MPADDKLPISIVNGLINDAIEKERLLWQAAIAKVESTVNTNATTTQDAVQKLNSAVSTLDSDFKASLQKKPFSLGFLSFDFEE